MAAFESEFYCLSSERIDAQTSASRLFFGAGRFLFAGPGCCSLKCRARTFEAISRNLDSASAGDLLPAEESGSGDEVGLVSLKIAHLGRQIRDTTKSSPRLRDNVEQVMTKLQDGLMLFTRDSRVVLVSASAEKFLGRPRREILGRTAEEIFRMEPYWAR